MSPDTPNVMQTMMQLEQAKNRAKTVNKVALEVQKEKDDAEQEVKRIHQVIQPKRSRTHPTTVNVRGYCWCEEGAAGARLVHWCAVWASHRVTWSVSSCVCLFALKAHCLEAKLTVLNTCHCSPHKQAHFWGESFFFPPSFPS